ncbi:unnamed protein product [Auanema sp. JU1783]|nr:unnamed protein product [Auanema sp. JU1783]
MITVNDVYIPENLFLLHLGLLIIEMVLMAVAFIYTMSGSYIILFLHPIFHPHVLGITTNFFISYFVLSVPRLCIIFPFLLDGTRRFEIMSSIPYTVYLDALRTVAASSALLACLSLVLERVIATVRIRTYEKQRNPFLIGLIMISTWLVPSACCYSVVILNFEIMIFLLLGFLTSLISFAIFLRLTNWSENEYKKNVNAYSLSIKYQLSENVRLGRIIKSTLKAFISGCFACLLIAFLTIKIFPSNNLFVFLMYHLYESLFAYLPIKIISCSINSNVTWKTSFRDITRTSLFNKTSNKTRASEPVRVLSLTGDVITVDQRLHAKQYFSTLDNMWK